MALKRALIPVQLVAEGGEAGVEVDPEFGHLGAEQGGLRGDAVVEGAFEGVEVAGSGDIGPALVGEQLHHGLGLLGPELFVEPLEEILS